LNFGSGGTAIQKKSRRPFEKQKIYQDALTSNADIIVFQFGTNDIRKFNWNENLFKIDYIDIIERFQSLFSNPIVFICIPPPVYCIDCIADIQPNVSNNVLPNIIREIAYTTGTYIHTNIRMYYIIMYIYTSIRKYL
jgi:acyl-CoA thioesterase-1